MNILKYHHFVNKIREFFIKKSFIEIPINYNFELISRDDDNLVELSSILMNNLDFTGCYASDKKIENPLIFDIVSRGTFEDAINLQMELLEYLNIAKKSSIKRLDYLKTKKELKTKELDSVSYEQLYNLYPKSTIHIINIPVIKNTQWNIKQHESKSFIFQSDCIIYGHHLFKLIEFNIDQKEMTEIMHKNLNDTESNKILKDCIGEGGSIEDAKNIILGEFNDFIKIVDNYHKKTSNFNNTHMIQKNKNLFGININLSKLIELSEI